MINFKLDDILYIIKEKLETTYPQLKDVSIDVVWCDKLDDEEPRVAGRFVIFEDGKFEIRINPHIDFVTIFIDTLPHEFAHLLEYLDIEEVSHGELWKKYNDEIIVLFLEDEECEC